MFQKKDIIYSETLGVCRIEEVTKLVDKRGETIMYYGLKSVKDGKTAYIPVENHSVVLRELINEETAKANKENGYDDRTINERFEIDYVLNGR